MSESNSLRLALALPSMDIQALIRGVTAAALPHRSLKSGQSFFLYPVETQFSEQPYHPYLEITELPQPPSPSQIWIEAWAKCERCETISQTSELEALANCTIWTASELKARKENRAYVFVAYLKVHKLPEKVAIKAIVNIQAKIGKTISIGQSLNIDPSTPILSTEQFNQQFQDLQSRKPAHHPQPQHTTISQPEVEPIPTVELIEPEPPTPPSISPEPEPITTSPVFPSKTGDDDQWIDQIAAIGNSSQGHEFERLVRKALIFLGFANTIDNAKASLNPDSTGGPGGLDFYADWPYALVGECKATKTEKVSDGTPAQLIKLGHKILQEHYDNCVKIIIAAGELTEDANQTALGNRLNVIRPETLQNLTQLKKHYSGSINLQKLKSCLDHEPFGEEADQKLKAHLHGIIHDLQIRSDLVKLIKQGEGDLQFLRGRFYGTHPLQDQEMQHILIELASPLTGYIGWRK
ncbi:MAG: DUF1802 family protein, partial [Spirulina sp. DLM2.Bin59]